MNRREFIIGSVGIVSHTISGPVYSRNVAISKPVQSSPIGPEQVIFIRNFVLTNGYDITTHAQGTINSSNILVPAYLAGIGDSNYTLHVIAYTDYILHGRDPNKIIFSPSLHLQMVYSDDPARTIVTEDNVLDYNYNRKATFDREDRTFSDGPVPPNIIGIAVLDGSLDKATESGVGLDLTNEGIRRRKQSEFEGIVLNLFRNLPRK